MVILPNTINLIKGMVVVGGMRRCYALRNIDDAILWKKLRFFRTKLIYKKEHKNKIT